MPRSKQLVLVANPTAPSVRPARSSLPRNAGLFRSFCVWGLLLLGLPTACEPAAEQPLPQEEHAGIQEALNSAVTVSFQEGVNAYAGTTDTYIRQGAATKNYGAETTC